MNGILLLFSLLVLSSLACAERYTLHHRINPSSSWSARGIITLNEEGGSPSYEDLTGKARPWDALNEFQANSPHLYQLALTPEGDKTVSLSSPITFARVCLLETASDESLTLHQRKGEGSQSQVFGLSYDLVGLDASKLDNVGCPSEANISKKNLKALNIQVAMPEAPLSLLPPSPPPVKADGTPLPEGEELPKEKSFVAKYWYYFVPILLLMAIPTELADKENEDSEEGAGGENPFQAGAQRGTAHNAVRVGNGNGGARKR